MLFIVEIDIGRYSEIASSLRFRDQ